METKLNGVKCEKGKPSVDIGANAKKKPDWNIISEQVALGRKTTNAQNKNRPEIGVCSNRKTFQLQIALKNTEQYNDAHSRWWRQFRNKYV